MPAPAAPLGQLITAMVTPFGPDGAVDLGTAQSLAVHLVDGLGHDGLVLNGTTGEAPTTSDDEKSALIRAVREAVGDRARVIAGVGTYDTAHSIHLARQAAAAGADGLLVVTPYYSRPSQEGIIAHMRAVADATDLPVTTYDIPKRTGVGLDVETLVTLAEHPRIVANKDAKGDLESSQWVLARCDLAWYSGDDILNLPLLSIGAAGFISVVGHVVGDRLGDLIRAYRAGEVDRARDINASLLPVYTGCFRGPGVVMTKAALALTGRPAGGVRAPLLDATPEQIAVLRSDLLAGGVAGIEVAA